MKRGFVIFFMVFVLLLSMPIILRESLGDRNSINCNFPGGNNGIRAENYFCNLNVVVKTTFLDNCLIDYNQTNASSGFYKTVEIILTESENTQLQKHGVLNKKLNIGTFDKGDYNIEFGLKCNKTNYKSMMGETVSFSILTPQEYRREIEQPYWNNITLLITAIIGAMAVLWAAKYYGKSKKGLSDTGFLWILIIYYLFFFIIL